MNIRQARSVSAVVTAKEKSKMAITELKLSNFTVFDSLEMKFSPGINVLIGENGTGKTHIMKVLYSACQGAKEERTLLSFQIKLKKVFSPDEMNRGHLVRQGKINANIIVYSEETNVCLSFDKGDSQFSAMSPPLNGRFGWNQAFKDVSSVFIPAEEILSHAKNLVQAIEVGNVHFDDTYRDIILAASVNVSKQRESEIKQQYLQKLHKAIGGDVRLKEEEFYLENNEGAMLEFQLVAEGERKLALLWQLIKNGALEPGSVLFWDEPEANINPKHIPLIADLLLDLARNGVQVFIATHNYALGKYIGLRSGKDDDLLFHNLIKDDSKKINYSSDRSFELVDNNGIIAQYISLYEEDAWKGMR
jgi:predicted ATPase